MQHSNFRSTSKLYIDRREVAKQMIKNGFGVFEEKIKLGTPVGHSRLKKRRHKSVTPDIPIGTYWIRTSDPYPGIRQPTD